MAKPEKDIRNFFKKPSTNGSVSATTTSGQVGKNIFGFNNFANKSTSTEVRPSVSSGGGSQLNRVTSFKDLASMGTSNVNNNNNNPTVALGKGYVLGRGSPSNVRGRGIGGKEKGGGMLANRGGSTLVIGSQVQKKPIDKGESPNTKLRVDNFKIFSGSGFTLGSSASDRSRSRLLNIGHEPEQKRRKSDTSVTAKKDELDQMCRCSVCNKSMPREEVDEHMESCVGLQNVFNNTTSVDETEISSLNQKYKITICPICAVNVEGNINIHIDECLNTSGVLNMFDEAVIELSDDETSVTTLKHNNSKPKFEDSDIEIVESEDRVACPLCGMRFGESRINEHVNQCLDSD